MISVVYFVQILEKQRAQKIQIGDIKIGTSANFHLRFYDHQRHYGRLKLIGMIQGTQSDEHEIHQHFAAYRIKRTECFKPAQELLDFINNLPPMTLPLPMKQIVKNPLKAWWFRVPK